eukprot:79603_1
MSILLLFCFFVHSVYGNPCGHYLGRPLDTCTDIKVDWNESISFKFSCDNDIYSSTMYYSANCDEGDDFVELNDTIIGSYCKEEANCQCEDDSDYGECVVIEHHEDDDCYNDYYTTNHYVENACYTNFYGDFDDYYGFDGSFIVTCSDVVDGEPEFDYYDDDACDCKEEEDLYEPQCTANYQSSTNDDKECGHYLEFPLNECSFIYSSSTDSWAYSYKYICEEDEFYILYYYNDGCQGDAYNAESYTSSNLTYNCEYGDCSCTSSAFCDIMESTMYYNCDGDYVKSLYVTNVCLLNDEDGDVESYDLYSCDDGEEVVTTYYDSECESTENECETGYTSDCTGTGSCGYWAIYPLDECVSYGYSSYEFVCSDDVYEQIYYMDEGDCTGNSTSTDLSMYCIDYEPDSELNETIYGYYDCNCGDTTEECTMATYTSCYDSSMTGSILIDQCNLYYSSGSQDIYLINECVDDINNIDDNYYVQYGNIASGYFDDADCSVPYDFSIYTSTTTTPDNSCDGDETVTKCDVQTSASGDTSDCAFYSFYPLDTC